jgi:hypothetical protein
VTAHKKEDISETQTGGHTGHHAKKAEPALDRQRCQELIEECENPQKRQAMMAAGPEAGMPPWLELLLAMARAFLNNLPAK